MFSLDLHTRESGPGCVGWRPPSAAGDAGSTLSVCVCAHHHIYNVAACAAATAHTVKKIK